MIGIVFTAAAAYLPAGKPTDACGNRMDPIAPLAINMVPSAGDPPVKLNGALRGIGSLASCSVRAVKSCSQLCRRACMLDCFE